jgi:HSP20 family molecular chaperone IbpA
MVVEIELPGMEKKGIQVTVSDDTLTIEGERKAETEVKDEDYSCCERRAGRFCRAIALPTGVDASKIKAHYRQGVLEVHLSHRCPTKMMRIFSHVRRPMSARSHTAWGNGTGDAT